MGKPCDQPSTALVSYLVGSCAGQAAPSFVWGEEERSLDVWLSKDQPSGSMPAACDDPPLTSRALLEAATWSYAMQCPELDLHESENAYVLEGAYQTVDVCTPEKKGDTPSCAPGKVFIPTHVTGCTPLTPTPVAHYLYTLETGYHEIKLFQNTLVYRTLGKPAVCADPTWSGSPCWSSSDLIDYHAPLSSADMLAIQTAITNTGFFGLAGTLGGAGMQRYYPVLLAARDSSGMLKEVTYQSYPEATPMPSAFVAAFEVLSAVACKKLGKQVGGPFPASALGCP